jgi:hypothetical protein
LTVLVFSGCEDKVNVECKVDSDCVKDSCCHAVGCVAMVDAPDCKDVMCSMECVPDTLDCGQGSCRCVDNKCFAVMNS